MRDAIHLPNLFKLLSNCIQNTYHTFLDRELAGEIPFDGALVVVIRIFIIVAVLRIPPRLLQKPVEKEMAA
jgi:hypothetical protein